STVPNVAASIARRTSLLALAPLRCSPLKLGGQQLTGDVCARGRHTVPGAHLVLHLLVEQLRQLLRQPDVQNLGEHPWSARRRGHAPSIPPPAPRVNLSAAMVGGGFHRLPV